MSRAEGFIGEHDFYRRCVNFKHLPFSARVFLLCIKLPQGLIYAMGRRRGLHFQQMSPSLCFCARWHLTQWAHALTPAGICSASLFLQLDPEVTEEQRFIYLHCLGAASPRDGGRRGVGAARSLNGALTSWHRGCRHPASVLWTCCRGPVALASPYPQEVLKYLNPQSMFFPCFLPPSLPTSREIPYPLALFWGCAVAIFLCLSFLCCVSVKKWYNNLPVCNKWPFKHLIRTVDRELGFWIDQGPVWPLTTSPLGACGITGPS